MRRLSILAALLACSAAFAAEDPSARIGKDIARLREIKQKPAEISSGGYASEREAAVAFVDAARRLPDQRMEYCAYVLRGEDKRFRLSPTRQGDMNHCPADRPKPASAVASVHTHPLGGRDSDASAAGQVFSEGDFAFAESDEMHMPIYLGAPAGHVLRYAPGHSFCRGQSFIRRDFEIVRDLRPSVAGRLPVNPGVDAALYSESGAKLPKPAYCL